MPKKSGRPTVGLNLTPELPEVVSRDFNLFYTPQPEPLPAGVKEFASALENFVNTGGTKAVISSELEDKKINSAQAQQDYLENKLAFKDAIKAGKIEATGNPYYLDKYKELTLNSFASEFSAKLGDAYETQKIKENITPNSFDNFYKNQLGGFIKDKGLSAFNPLDLEKGFFKETTAFRNQFEQNHRAGQLKIFREKVNEKIANKVGAVINQFSKLEDDAFAESGAGYNKYNLMADGINALISEMVDVNGDGREIVDVVFEGLKKWTSETKDYKLAKTIISELPDKLLAGTNSFENIERIKSEKEKLFTTLIEKNAERVSKSNQLNKGQREQVLLETYNYLTEETAKNPDFDVTGWSNQKGRTGSEKQGAADFLKDQTFDRGNTDNPEVIRKLDKLIDEGKHEVATQYTREQYQQGNLRFDTKNKYLGEYISDAINGKYDAALQNKIIKTNLTAIEKIISDGKGGDNSIEAQEFKIIVTTKLRSWYKHNSANYKNQYELDNALEAEYIQIRTNLKNLGRYTSLFGKLDDSLSIGAGKNLVENADIAIAENKKQQELAKEKIRQENKNLKDDDFQKLYNEKQKEKKKFYANPEEAKKAKEREEKEKELQGLRDFNAWKERPIGERLKEAFDINANRPKKPKEPNDKK